MRCWPPGRRRSPPPRDTSSLRWPCEAGVPLAAPASPLPEGCGAGATLQPGPRGPGPSFSFAVSLPWGAGGGTGVAVALPPPAITASSPGQHLHGLELGHQHPCAQGAPSCPQDGLWDGGCCVSVPSSPPASASRGVTGTLPAPDPPSERWAARTAGSPSTHVLKHLGCPLGKVHGRWLAAGGFGVLQVPG